MVATYNGVPLLCSPPTREWTGNARNWLSDFKVLPADAGVDRSRGAAVARAAGAPC
ncbi:hypothetical protein ACWDSL_18905 [Streptomyces sp. NPDC000941]